MTIWHLTYCCVPFTLRLYREIESGWGSKLFYVLHNPSDTVAPTVVCFSVWKLLTFQKRQTTCIYSKGFKTLFYTSFLYECKNEVQILDSHRAILQVIFPELCILHKNPHTALCHQLPIHILLQIIMPSQIELPFDTVATFKVIFLKPMTGLSLQPVTLPLRAF